MASSTEQAGGVFDSVKIFTALAIVSGAIVAFTYFGDESLLLRVVGLLVAVALAVAVFLQTDKGRALQGFLKDSHIEVRKVVWPTKQETTQTTGIVMLMVLIVAVFLYLLDLFLGWAIRGLTGLGG